MPEPAISVIIPTFNRTRELRICLDGFVHQERVSNDDFEILIIDDGSTEDVASLVHQFQDVLNVRFLRTAQCGAGVARNAGLQLAAGALILLYDDDAQPTPDLISYCLEFHREHPAESDMALLCFEPEVTPEESQFERWAFDKIYPFPERSGVYDWRFFWTCTLTLKKSVFRYGEFDPAFRMVEDTELGMRLHDGIGIRVHYQPRSYSTFVRRLTLKQICRRQYTIAYFSYRTAEKHGRAGDFMWKPYDAPEQYVVRDEQRLVAMAAIARSFDERRPAGQKKVITTVIREVFSSVEMHCAAKGWMAARDGLPVDPVTNLAPLLDERY